MQKAEADRWKQAAERRHDMVGIEEGVDRDATEAVLCSKSLSVVEKGILRNVLSGAVWTKRDISRGLV